MVTLGGFFRKFDPEQSAERAISILLCPGRSIDLGNYNAASLKLVKSKSLSS